MCVPYVFAQTSRVTHIMCTGVCSFSCFSWQIRRVTVLFVNLGLKEQTLLAAAVYDEAMEEMHRVSRPKQGETRGLR